MTEDQEALQTELEEVIGPLPVSKMEVRGVLMTGIWHLFV